MKKIKNPWVNIDGFQCFACSPDNEHGLQMEFFEDNDEIVCIWEPKPHFQSWVGTLHGGIQSTLIDEIGGWIVHHSLKTASVTSKLDVRYKKNIGIENQRLTIRGKIDRMMRNIAVVTVTITDKDGEICTTGEGYYFTYPQEVAREKFSYRDLEFEEDNK